jgi:ribosomal protein L40E
MKWRKTVKCTKCGAEVYPEFSFCTKCGHDLPPKKEESPYLVALSAATLISGFLAPPGLVQALMLIIVAFFWAFFVIIPRVSPVILRLSEQDVPGIKRKQ